MNYRESMSYSPEQGMPPGFADLPGRDLMLGFVDNPILYVIGFGLLSLALSLLTRVVGWWSKGALIGMVEEADRMGTTSVVSGCRVGTRRAIPLLLISILLGLPQVAPQHRQLLLTAHEGRETALGRRLEARGAPAGRAVSGPLRGGR